MLDGGALGQKLFSAIKEMTDSSAAHNVIAQTINSYIQQNAVLNGVYTGMTTTVPPVPDPMNGPKKFQVQMCMIQGSALAGAAKGSFDAWLAMIGMQIVSTLMFMPAGGGITTIPGKLAACQISASITKMTDPAKCWETIGKGIVNAIKAGPPVPTGPGMTPSPGAGVVVFSNVE